MKNEERKKKEKMKVGVGGKGGGVPWEVEEKGFFFGVTYSCIFEKRGYRPAFTSQKKKKFWVFFFPPKNSKLNTNPENSKSNTTYSQYKHTQKIQNQTQHT